MREAVEMSLPQIEMLIAAKNRLDAAQALMLLNETHIAIGSCFAKDAASAKRMIENEHKRLTQFLK